MSVEDAAERKPRHLKQTLVEHTGGAADVTVDAPPQLTVFLNVCNYMLI